MSDEIKVYADIHADTVSVPTDEQWQALVAEAKEETLAAAILARARAAHNIPTYHKRSQGAGQVNRHALLSFEIDRVDRDDLVAVLDTEAAARGISGNRRQKFDDVFTAELQDAATAIGFGAQAANISVTLIAIGDDRAEVEATAAAYIKANDAVWHE